ncbi:hypothetical protein C1645_770783, partial [Glomus cerebriforme]
PKPFRYPSLKPFYYPSLKPISLPESEAHSLIPSPKPPHILNPFHLKVQHPKRIVLKES